MAVVYRMSGEAACWRDHGWTRVRAGGCETSFLTAAPSYFIRAESPDARGGRRIWAKGGDQLCIIYPGP